MNIKLASILLGITKGLSVRPLTRLRSSSQLSSSAADKSTWQQDVSLQECQEIMVVAQQAAMVAGKTIRSHLGCSSEVGGLKESTDFKVKTTIKDIVTQYDSQAQHAVEDIIRKSFPEHSFLGEENVAPGAAASEQALVDALQETPSGFVWICDPIDGTANFAAGLPLCGVTVSVIFKGDPIVGVIYDPNSDEMFSAIRGHGAYLNNNIPLVVAKTTTDIKDAIINAGCPSDPNAFAVSMKGVLALNSKCRGLRMIACSALTTAWIAAGRMTAHFGYDLSSWDLVAGALIIHEAGGRVTDLDGSPYKVTTRNMLCSNGAIHDQVLKALKDADAIAFSRSTS
ncbi:myo-inositol-1(or 4)-monophosphatase [Fistulifera solaris]|uniref:Inositol-1-monophosphatase n=1 Tax=Fistulifera solaris TaxID=1519565 RepID=A0A1Z5JZ86_FISSO|nr:myo-inositol-1(or 4)-monophosphatase [Fistulifera solaris]|eukprot:GAX19335.1 myo-inositol-1(or 4)-monophosphatase [Fistulifera solaris]